MILYIAEKPSLGRAIAEVLPKPHKKEDGFIRVANGDCVSWCIGHLLEQAEPHIYDPQFKQWKLEHLPIIPEQWKLLPKPKTKKQLSVIKRLAKEADGLVHVGDPDREGQLLVDEVIRYIGYKEQASAPVQRCLISDLNPSAVKKALERLRNNREFVPLSTSALARARADWLYGINMTRAYTLQGRKVGYNGVLSVGRVQTPILGLVVRRDEEIENFVAKDYFEVMAYLRTEEGEEFRAKWKPSDACRPHMDEDGHVLNKALAENVVKRVSGQTGEVSKLEKKRKTQPPPLPYNLSSLQIDAARRFAKSAQQVLDICQTLYERHKLITYPRSDSRYLPEEHFAQAADVVASIANNDEALAAKAAKADVSLKTKAWNDKKVDAHHAIIPTVKKTDLSRLSQDEQQIYSLIATQYVAQFYPVYEYSDTYVEVIIAGGLFTAREHETLKMGWKELFAKDKVASDSSKSAEDSKSLPSLTKGQQLHCDKATLLEKQTQPPKYFTDATLLSAITGIARFVKDPEIRKVLRDTDGLGTEATRAGILELLFKREFLQRKAKQIRATDAGKGLIHSLPEIATRPDMTAQWESRLDSISQRQDSYNGFMGPLTTSLCSFIDEARARLPTELRGIAVRQPRRKKRA